MEGSTSATSTPGRTLSNYTQGEKTYFEKQREALISEIAVSLEHVLANINTLNRSLEGVISVGKEFESVSVLWSSFYDSMAHETHNEANDEMEVTMEDDTEDS
ncbi:DASH complex subunit Dad1-domain-containing protein [Dipodascopsis uninucleata]